MSEPQETRESFLDTLMGQAAAIAAMVAGTVGLLYAIGGAVMWLRFHNAGLPADQAVALVPRTDLLVVGLRVMVLPVVASGVVALLLARALAARRARRLHKLETEHEQATKRLEDLPAAGATEERDAIKQCVDDIETALKQAEELPSTLTAQLPRPKRNPGMFAALLVAAVALVLIVPFSVGALAWPLMLGAVLAYWLRLSSGDGRFIAWKLAVAAMLAGCVISVARQTATPIQLPSVRAEIARPPDLLLTSFRPGESERPKTVVVEGYLVADSDKELDIGVVGTGSMATIATIPKSDVTFMMITPPLDLRAPPRSLLSVAMGGKWAWTPAGFWCQNLRYGWTRIGDACAAQPRIAMPPALEIEHGRISRLAVSCPAEANGSCGGFVNLTTTAPALQGARLAPVTASQKFSATAGSDFPLMFPLDNAELWKAFDAGSAATHCDDSRDYCVPVAIRVSLDEAGRAVLEQRNAVLRLVAPKRAPARHPRRDSGPKRHKKHKHKQPKAADGGGTGQHDGGGTNPHTGGGGGGGGAPQNGGGKPDAEATPQAEETATPEPTVTPDQGDPVPPSNDPITAPTPTPDTSGNAP